MKLSNVHSVGAFDQPVDIEISGESILSITPHNKKISDAIAFENALVFPGLINAHDHLEFNLFPQLKSKNYTNYIEWGKDIHARFKEQINATLKVPEHLRTEWGIIKNLLNGVTTVVDHGRTRKPESYLIDVYQNFNYLHALATESNWKLKLNNPLNRRPCMIHIGEGVDESMQKEVAEIIKWNLFHKPIIGIHGISMTDKQAAHFEALIWCPDSNKFLYDQTAHVTTLKNNTTILFGTDSTLSASANLWEQLRKASELQLMSDEELFHSITKSACEVFGLKAELQVGNRADLVVAKNNGASCTWDSFYSINQEDLLLIVKNGRVIYFDASIEQQLCNNLKDAFRPIRLGNSKKFVPAKVVDTLKSIGAYDVELPLPLTGYE